MSRHIDDADRIINAIAPTDPTDRSLMNADIINDLFNKVLNGQYRSKACSLYTYAQVVALADKEPGEIFYTSDTKQFIAWDGVDLVIFGGE